MNPPPGASWPIVVLLILASGSLGAVASSLIYVFRDKKMFKVDTLRRFAANRYDLRGDEFSRAANEIFVVFNGSSEVMNRLEGFHGAVNHGRGDVEDKLLKLYKAMCDDVGIDYTEFNDSFHLTPFNTRSSSQSGPPASAGP